MSVEVNWPALRTAAQAAMTLSYSPYSEFAVGAAALVDDGAHRRGLQRRERVLRAHPVPRVRSRFLRWLPLVVDGSWPWLASTVLASH